MSPLLLTLLPFLIGPAITLLVFLILFRARARVARGEPAVKVPAKAALRGFAFLAATLMSLWFGFVGAAVIGAVAPRAVMFAADMACPGGVKHDSFDYLYKPGQRGTSQVYMCELPGQAPKEITGRTFVYAGLSFSAAALVFLLVAWAFVKPLLARFWHRIRNASTANMGVPPWSGGSMSEAFGQQPQRPQAQRSMSERLKALEELYRGGTINREEYDAARARLLSEI